MSEDAFGANVSAYLTVDEKGAARHIHPFAYMRSTVNADLAGAVRRIAPRINMDAIHSLFDEIPAEAYGWRILTETTKEAQLRLLERRYREGLLPLV